MFRFRRASRCTITSHSEATISKTCSFTRAPLRAECSNSNSTCNRSTCNRSTYNRNSTGTVVTWVRLSKVTWDIRRSSNRTGCRHSNTAWRRRRGGNLRRSNNRCPCNPRLNPNPPGQDPRAQQPPAPKPPAPAPAPAPKSAWGNPNPPASEGVILPAARNAAPPPGGVARPAETVKAPKPKPKPTSFAAAALNAMAPDELARMKAAPKTTVRAQTSSGRGVPPPRTGGRGGRGGRGAAPVVPKEEFNFAKMLQRFNKEKLAQSAEAKKLSTEVQAKPVYVKDDFFDTMSSEATDKASGKPRFHEQRRMDAMTFGFDAVSASHAAQRRGGWSGGRAARQRTRRRAGGRGGRSVGRGGRN